jgi:autotransporter passenger strand-loop-strand repeat protein
VFAGGLTISTTLAGEQDIYGLASGTVLASGGLQNVEAGGSAVDTAIASRGEQDVDGIASGTVIASDGLQVVEADGIAFATIVSSGGKQGVFGYASGATVFAGSEVVEAGGSAIDFTILSGGVLVVSSGGYADPGTLSGGTEVISAGGSDDRTQISGGTQFVYGTATNAAVFVGSQVVESGGFASGTVVSGVCWSSSPAVLQSMQLSTAAVQLSSLGAVPLTLSRFPAPPSK